MAEIVNLRTVRKARKREDQARLADANRAHFGRTKAERVATSLERQRLDAALDGAKREPE